MGFGLTKCIYIASPSFSGSTVLTMLLGGHPDVVTVGELKGGQENLDTYTCSCGALIRCCPFWLRLVATLADHGYTYDLSDRRTMPAFGMPSAVLADRVIRRRFGSRFFELSRDVFLALWPGCRRRITYIQNYTQDFIDILLRQVGASVFVDSSKDPIRIKYLSQMPSIELYVVHLIRDGRGVSNSARKNERITVAAAAAEWRNTNLEIERVTRRHCAGRTLRVSYEAFCDSPERVLTEILGFAGLGDQYSLPEAATRELHLLGNRARLRTVLPLRVDESWREQLQNADLTVFEQIAGNLNRRYGYSAARALPAAC